MHHPIMQWNCFPLARMPLMSGGNNEDEDDDVTFSWDQWVFFNSQHKAVVIVNVSWVMSNEKWNNLCNIISVPKHIWKEWNR